MMNEISNVFAMYNIGWPDFEPCKSAGNNAGSGRYAVLIIDVAGTLSLTTVGALGGKRQELRALFALSQACESHFFGRFRKIVMSIILSSACFELRGK